MRVINKGKKGYKKRWITLNRAVEVVKENCNVIITKGGIKEFENLITDILDYDFFSINKIFIDDEQEVAEKFYALVYYAEKTTKLLKIFKEIMNYDSLNSPNQNLTVKKIVELKEKREKIMKKKVSTLDLVIIKKDMLNSFSKTKSEFFQKLRISIEEQTIVANTLYEKAKELSNEIIEINNKFLMKAIRKDDDLVDDMEFTIKGIEKTNPENMELNLKEHDFALSIALLVSLRQAVLTNNIMIKQQRDMYKEFSEIPLLKSEKLNINSIVRQLKIFRDNKEKDALTRKIQRIVKDHFDSFIKNISWEPMLKLVTKEKIQLIFIGLLLKEEIKDNEDKIIKESRIIKIVKDIANGKEINAFENDYINNYFLYKFHELFLGEYTYDFMLKRLRIEELLDQKFENEMIEFINDF